MYQSIIHNIYAPVHIKIYYTDPQTEDITLLEDWFLNYKRPENDDNSNLDRFYYAKLVVLLRGIYSFLRLMPAYELFQSKNSRQNLSEQLSYSIEHLGGDSAFNDISDFTQFGEIATTGGTVQVSVEYLRHIDIHRQFFVTDFVLVDSDYKGSTDIPNDPSSRPIDITRPRGNSNPTRPKTYSGGIDIPTTQFSRSGFEGSGTISSAPLTMLSFSPKAVYKDYVGTPPFSFQGSGSSGKSIADSTDFSIETSPSLKYSSSSEKFGSFNLSISPLIEHVPHAIAGLGSPNEYRDLSDSYGNRTPDFGFDRSSSSTENRNTNEEIEQFISECKIERLPMGINTQKEKMGKYIDIFHDITKP
eukprot:TRINITY_DN3223_c0_g1_i1.p1 TRINITY_DN3223_c0_g1~~TRINITY_DN3223_c0_g1_i1.p1  ORF type:complete len:359 (+),score=81.99 TRINITY_DN3223_c0_g1_i1:743-1819(+)